MNGLRARRAVRIVSAIAGPIVMTIGYFTLPLDYLDRRHQALSWLVLGGLVVVMAAGMSVLTGRAMREDAPGHPAFGIIMLSWASVLLFSASYYAMSLGPGEFIGLKTRLDALYFTAVTLATVGYGDITPSGQVSRAIVMVQLLYSFAFLAAGFTALTNRLRRRRSSERERPRGRRRRDHER